MKTENRIFVVEYGKKGAYLPSLIGLSWMTENYGAQCKTLISFLCAVKSTSFTSILKLFLNLESI